MSWAPRTTEPRPCRPVVKDAGQPARTNLGEPSCGIRKRLMKLNAGLKRLAVVQSVSCVRLFVTTWTAVPQASLTFTVSQSLLNPMSIELVMPSNHLILCHPLLLFPSIFSSISNLKIHLSVINKSNNKNRIKKQTQIYNHQNDLFFYCLCSHD